MNPFPFPGQGAELFPYIEPVLNSIGLIRGATSQQESLVRNIQSLSLERLLGTSKTRVDPGHAVKAGLFLGVDAWEEAHAIAQDLDTAEGSYWHGIVHRREPDSANARYWFRRVGNHPVFQLLASKESRQMLPSHSAFDEITKSGTWDPLRFIDLCNAGDCLPHLRDELMALQAREVKLLIQYCVRMAIE